MSSDGSLLETVKLFLVIIACLAVITTGYFLFSSVKSRASLEGANLVSNIEMTLSGVDDTSTVSGDYIQISLEEEPESAVYVLCEKDSLKDYAEFTDNKTVLYEGVDTILVNVGKRHVSKDNIRYDAGQRAFVAHSKLIEDEKIPLASLGIINDKQKFKSVDLKDKSGSDVGIVYVMVDE